MPARLTLSRQPGCEQAPMRISQQPHAAQIRGSCAVPRRQAAAVVASISSLIVGSADRRWSRGVMRSLAAWRRRACQAVFQCPACFTGRLRRCRPRRCMWRAGPAMPWPGRIAWWCAGRRGMPPPGRPAVGARRSGALLRSQCRWWADPARDQVQHRRLSAPGPAHHRHRLTLRDLQDHPHPGRIKRGCRSGWSPR
jgi:hypothetical protein